MQGESAMPILDTAHGRDIQLQQALQAAAASLNNDRDEDIEQIQQTEKLLGDGYEDTALCEVEDCNEVVSSSDKSELCTLLVSPHLCVGEN